MLEKEKDMTQHYQLPELLIENQEQTEENKRISDSVSSVTAKQCIQNKLLKTWTQKFTHDNKHF